MINTMIEKIKIPSYHFKKPFNFLNIDYNDSLSLMGALMEHWDVGIAALKAGCFANYHQDYVGDFANLDSCMQDFEKELWKIKDYESCDAIFSILLHYIEPKIDMIPYVDATTRKGYFLSRKVCMEALTDVWKGPSAYPMFEIIVVHNMDARILDDDLYWDKEYNKSMEMIMFFMSMFTLGGMELYGYDKADVMYQAHMRKVKNKAVICEYYDQIKLAFSDAAEFVFETFEFEGKKFTSYEAFIKNVIFGIESWDLSRWEEVTTSLAADEDSIQSFADWLSGIGHTSRCQQFMDWKREFEGVQLEKELTVKAVDFPIKEYVKEGNRKWHDEFLLKFEKEAIEYYEISKNYYVSEKVDLLEEKYKKLLGILRAGYEDKIGDWEGCRVCGDSFPAMKIAYRENMVDCARKYELQMKFVEYMKSYRVMELLDEIEEIGMTRKATWTSGKYTDELSVDDQLVLLAASSVTDDIEEELKVFLAFWKKQQEKGKNVRWGHYTYIIDNHIYRSLKPGTATQNLSLSYLKLFSMIKDLAPAEENIPKRLGYDPTVTLVNKIKTQISYSESFQSGKIVSAKQMREKWESQFGKKATDGETIFCKEFKLGETFTQYEAFYAKLDEIEAEWNRLEKEAEQILARNEECLSVENCCTLSQEEIQYMVNAEAEKYKEIVSKSQSLLAEWEKNEQEYARLFHNVEEAKDHIGIPISYLLCKPISAKLMNEEWKREFGEEILTRSFVPSSEYMDDPICQQYQSIHRKCKKIADEWDRKDKWAKWELRHIEDYINDSGCSIEVRKRMIDSCAKDYQRHVNESKGLLADWKIQKNEYAKIHDKYQSLRKDYERKYLEEVSARIKMNKEEARKAEEVRKAEEEARIRAEKSPLGMLKKLLNKK